MGSGILRAGSLIPGCEGKTKEGYEAVRTNGQVDPEVVWFRVRKDITKNNDASQTREFGTKATTSVTTNDCVMGLLLQAGLPVAYRGRVADDAFLAERCQMLGLEVVARRYYVGSSLKRHPELKVPDGQPPKRTAPIAVEFYVKTTGGKVRTLSGAEIDLQLGGDPDKEDPLIWTPYGDHWELYHPKKPHGSDTYLGGIDALGIVPSLEYVKAMEFRMRQVFLTLEAAWATLGLRFIDLKIEFGLGVKGDLLVADVIDNDSWRLRTEDWEELSKEAFRQNEDLTVVERKYLQVASLAEQLRYHSQPLALL